MKANAEMPPTNDRSAVEPGIIARFAQVVVLLAFQAGVLFFASGNPLWLWAWVFLAIYLVSVSINSAFMLSFSPDTVAERGKAKETKDWDKVVGGLWSLMQFLLIPLVAGLDERLGWTRDLSILSHIAGGLVFALGLGLFGWAMIANAFFSTAVRIQSDRGQTVCRTGPYRFVRHPGYTGTVLQSIGMPLLLGSLWAFIPVVIAVVLMVVRTSLEDKMLHAELSGYKDFADEVRFRLIPNVW